MDKQTFKEVSPAEGRVPRRKRQSPCLSDYTSGSELVHYGSLRHGKETIISDGEGSPPSVIHLDYITINW